MTNEPNLELTFPSTATWRLEHHLYHIPVTYIGLYSWIFTDASSMS